MERATGSCKIKNLQPSVKKKKSENKSINIYKAPCTQRGPCCDKANGIYSFSARVLDHWQCVSCERHLLLWVILLCKWFISVHIQGYNKKNDVWKTVSKNLVIWIHTIIHLVHNMYYSLLPHRFSCKKTHILFWLQYISIVTAFFTHWCCWRSKMTVFVLYFNLNCGESLMLWTQT